MRHWLLRGLFVLLVFGLVPGIVSADDQWNDDTWSQLEGRANDATQTINDLITQFNANPATVVAQVDDVTNRLRDISDQIDGLPSAPNSAIDGALAMYKTAIADFITGLWDFRLAYQAGNVLQENAAIDEINRARDNLRNALAIFEREDPLPTSAEVETRRARDQQEIHQLFVTGTIAFAALNVVLLILGLHAGPNEADQAKAGFYLLMFRTSLIPTIGFLITLGSYALARNGGTYLIATGAMVFGGFRLVRLILIYATELRPHLNAMGEAERLFRQHADVLWTFFQEDPGPAFAAAVARQFNASPAAADLLAAQFASFQPPSAAPVSSDAEQPYVILGVQPTDSIETIRTRYLELVKTYHPDVSGRDTAEEFIRIQRAYEAIEAIQQERDDPV